MKKARPRKFESHPQKYHLAPTAINKYVLNKF